jgi:DNA-binding winged helix-turn-helix (wHTH) protein
MAVFRMGEWEVNPSISQISCVTISRTLTPQHLLAIMAFIQASEFTLSKDDLLKQVWQGKIVSDDAITRLISDLRKQLQIENSTVKYIKTLHGFGYKLAIEPILIEKIVTKKINLKNLLVIAVSIFIGVAYSGHGEHRFRFYRERLRSNALGSRHF